MSAPVPAPLPDDVRTRLVAAVRTGDVAALEAVLDAYPDAAEAHEGGTSLALWALYVGQPGAAQALARRRARLGLHEAAALGRTDVLAVYLARDAENANLHAADGHTPLGLAVFFGQEGAARQLLAAGADPSLPARNAMAVAPLHAATARAAANLVRLLVDAGADVNARQQAGFTPLHGAAGAGTLALVELLLAAGADPEARTESGETAAMLARNRGHALVADWLEHHPAR